jgi:predicted metal-dependent hydrolase
VARVAEIPYPVRRSARARRARLVVRAEGVEVVVPEGVALGAVAPWVAGRGPWIERTLRRLRDERRSGPAARLEHGGAVPYFGEALALRVAVAPGPARVRRRGAELWVRVAEGGEAALRAALERWFREEARREVALRLDAACARAGRSYGRLTIRGQRTRWASCSPSGAMSFNWRLMLAPPAVLEYVVEHEVAHLEVASHGPAFRRLLAERCPDYRDHERWLRRHGAGLRL